MNNNANRSKGAIAGIIVVIIALIIEVMGLFNNNLLITDKMVNCALIVGLIAGLIFAFNGYKKNDADMYKVYMIIYAVALIINAVAGVFISNNMPSWTAIDYLAMILVVISIIAILILVFVKNLGKKVSESLVLYNMISTCGFSLYQIITLGDFVPYYSIYIGNILLSIIAYIFVKFKYADKASRGAK